LMNILYRMMYFRLFSLDIVQHVELGVEGNFVFD
jgi:hypothetical protein